MRFFRNLVSDPFFAKILGEDAGFTALIRMREMEES